MHIHNKSKFWWQAFIVNESNIYPNIKKNCHFTLKVLDLSIIRNNFTYNNEGNIFIFLYIFYLGDCYGGSQLEISEWYGAQKHKMFVRIYLFLIWPKLSKYMENKSRLLMIKTWIRRLGVVSFFKWTFKVRIIFELLWVIRC